jgi:hypothetical protein
MKTKNLLLASASLTIFSFSIILFQISCKKEATAQGTNTNCVGPQPKLQFKANGTLCQYNGVFNEKIGWIATPYISKQVNPTFSGAIYGLLTFYDLGDAEGTTYPAYLNNTGGWIYFPSTTQQLGVDSYQCTEFDARANGLRVQSGGITINITSFQNNYATGTLSGNLNTANGVVTITDGTFSNLPVIPGS